MNDSVNAVAAMAAPAPASPKRGDDPPTDAFETALGSAAATESPPGTTATKARTADAEGTKAEGDSSGLTVVGEVRSDEPTDAILERQRSRVPRELRFRVIFAQIPFHQTLRGQPTKTCQLRLLGQFDDIDRLCIELPSGEEVVLLLER